ncbi:ABC transporter ATP-binding protein [Paracoccus aerodenitrificans]|uniref:ABC transporter ATP-binding protein n=1 Tax=Paracoccus aerodenitrificans TaxID=3017781 RepID=UPI0022F0A037|nr:dipeptide ABC transporter ATP-binding protein [Paracoccus aerodenitrificans]WBU63206.1 dipeptide ABC transporter ATP-binding protein [Paracoccus aerodenitrificans]
MIEARNLSVTIRGTAVLRDVDLRLAPGKITGLVGESGSGKSMTALAVMGLLPRGSFAGGEVLLDGKNLLKMPEPALCRIRGNRIGMIFQEPMTALNPLMTIGDQVAEVLRIHHAMPRDQALARARDRLDRVGLPGPRFPLSLYPHELSGGQRQRVAIALAIAEAPDLLIADEPTTALDVTTQAQILDLLQDLVRDEGMSLLLITHDLAVVAGVADHVAVMKSGEIVEEGPTETLFRTQSHPYTRALFAASRYAPGGRTPVGPENAPILSVRNAVREYALPRPSLFAPHGVLRAVDDVSFDIRDGESVGLVGESGCGKSTLTRAILGLDPLQGGEILLAGEPVQAGKAMHAGLRARVQVVFQDPFGSFDPRWRVERLVAEPFHLTGRPPDWRDRVAEALRDVGMDPSAAGRYIHEFSGGQRQRLAVARALIIRPRLIVLDEAVSALDVRVRAQVLDLLAELRRSHGMSYLFISHDLGVVRGVTDRVLVMDKGKIVEQGPTAEVMDNPSHPTTQRLMAAMPVIPPEWGVA